MNKPSEPAHTVAADWLVGGGKMGELIRSMDWSQSPLGPRDSWPQSLRTTVSLCLSSNFPIAIVWGEHRIQLYNDGYWPICGSKHPQSMGQDFWECWPTSRPAIGHAFDQAAAGETAFIENQCVLLDRNGYLEETYFTFSFSPIHDESGKVGGLFHPVTELTQQTLAERRLKALRNLADATADARTMEQAIGLAATALSGHAQDLPFVLIYLIDEPRRQARLVATAGLAPGTPVTPEHIALDKAPDRPWPLARVVQSRQSEHMGDLESVMGQVTCGPYPEPMQDAMLLPVIVPGVESPVAVVIAGVSTRRALDHAYHTFYDMLGKGITTALSNARAYEEERTRLEVLAELDRAKTAFFSNVSHEFRTPLTLMLGPLHELLYSPSGVLNKYDRAQVEVAHRNALRLLKLVNSLLDFARIEAGRTQATYRPVDLAQLTGELSAMFRSAIEKAGLAFVVDCPPLPEPVYIDHDMWEKIVLNLISNAFKFTFSGTIAVQLRWHHGSAELTVSDTGVGVPPEHLPHLFERFYRVPHARSRTYEGSGIGLALAHELVKLHGGTIGVESEPYQGTTFKVRIPGGTAHLSADRIGAHSSLSSTAIEPRAFVEEALHWLPGDNAEQEAQEQRIAAASQPQSESVPGGTRRARILLADDNADMREYVCRLLAPYWEVEAVADGMQALEAAWRNPPDLVLTDVMMPNLDGFGLLRALRTDKRTRATPIIMLSARAGEEARVEGLEAGADDYLVKPFGARELLARINTHLDISRQRQEAVETAQHDELTGLPNRKLTMDFAERLFASARRGGKRVGVLFIDMDRFKPINDVHGHQVGDAVLAEIARRLKSCVRAGDIAGRIGGDEFLVVLSDVRDSTDAAQAARHIIDALGQPYHVAGLALHSSPSIGIAVFHDDGEDMEQLIRRSDIAMYHAKEQGRNNFQFFTQELNDSLARARHIENRLRAGLERGEFKLHYQPVIDITTQALVGVEALLRLPGMDLGPAEFIPVAEASGMMDALGNWIVHEACRQIRQWRDRQLPAWPLSINVSPLQLQQGTLHDAVAHALNEHGIDPSQLQLEFAETSVLKNKGDAIASARALKTLGVRIALDDFGKGYSDLNCLRLPLDAVKIDQEYVHRLASDKASMAVAEAIVAIGKTLGVTVIAAGIESAETLETVRTSECRQVQGFYVCPPVPPEELEEWYHHWQAAPGRFGQPMFH
ncbi:MAG TPA: EAL domain-containing protein [Noviherbaspirillum sp.]